ncbi:hypothetical protein ACIBM3_15505 [Rhodococcus erythropolis]|uniref:hypothetical protein n=1 Tax=Rhodococcus erythropolis TaxID=1833 RepID=UPI0037A2E234
MNLGDLWRYPFPVEIYGTVAAWVGSLLTGLSFAAAACYYIFDKRVEARSQARNIRVDYCGDDDRDGVTVHNFSDAPILNIEAQLVERPIGVQVVGKMPHEIRTNPSKLKKELKKISPIHDHCFWPVQVGLQGNGGQLMVPSGETRQFFGGAGGAFRSEGPLDLVLTFTDACGREWRIDVVTNKLERRAGSLWGQLKYKLRPSELKRTIDKYRINRITRKIKVIDTV